MLRAEYGEITLEINTKMLRKMNVKKSECGEKVNVEG